MDERFLPPLIEMMTGERTTIDMETDELTGSIPIDNVNNILDYGPSTSAESMQTLKERQRTETQLQVELQEEYHEEYVEEYMEENRTIKKETDNIISNVDFWPRKVVLGTKEPYNKNFTVLYREQVYNKYI